MKSPAAATFRTGFVTSKDGTRISYRQLGHGPALVLVPGGMQVAQNFMKLGTSLSDIAADDVGTLGRVAEELRPFFSRTLS